MENIEGVYRHYKGQLYQVRGVAHHSETLEPFVIYDADYANPVAKTWIRAQPMFFGKVTLASGEEVARFSRVADENDIPGSVHIVPYDSHWPEQFARVHSEILRVIGCSFDIEHIGSTSVPGLAAKNIVDVQLGVQNFEDVHRIIGQLDSLGLWCSPSFLQDHIPSQPVGEFSPEWEKRFCSGTIFNIKIHLHIRKISNPNWDYALLFRDFLRSHPEHASAYSQLKIRLSGTGISARDYTYIKDPAVDLIYWQAQQWRRLARSTSRF